VSEQTCAARNLDGSNCLELVTHYWGKSEEARLYYCCAHFSELVIAIYDANEALKQKRHEELVAFVEENTETLRRIVQNNPCPPLIAQPRKFLKLYGVEDD